MKFLLDTNVVSELRKGDRADPGVTDWFSSVDSSDLALSVLVLGEMEVGVARLERRDSTAAAQLADWLNGVRAAYRYRLLEIDDAVATQWAALNAVRPLPVIDSLLAATANVNGMTLVTRNVGDLHGVDVDVLNPFSEES